MRATKINNQLTNKQLQVVPKNTTTPINKDYIVRVNTDKNTYEKFLLTYFNIPKKNKTDYNFNDVNFIKLYKTQLKTMKHPALVEVLKIENGMVIFRYTTLTSSQKDINIHGEKVKVKQIGTYINKEGKEVPQYVAEASCIIKITQENFDLMFQKIEPEEIGIDEEKFLKIKTQMVEWEHKKALDFSEQILKDIEKFKVIDVEKLKQNKIMEDKITENKDVVNENKPKYDE